MITWSNSTLTHNNLCTAMGVHLIPFFDWVLYSTNRGVVCNFDENITGIVAVLPPTQICTSTTWFSDEGCLAQCALSIYLCFSMPIFKPNPKGYKGS